MPETPNRAIILENQEPSMTRVILISAILFSALATSGCVPVVVGAGAAIGADAIAENRGGDLF